MDQEELTHIHKEGFYKGYVHLAILCDRKFSVCIVNIQPDGDVCHNSNSNSVCSGTLFSKVLVAVCF